jgi:lysophospholipase L1-like esterase
LLKVQSALVQNLFLIILGAVIGTFPIAVIWVFFFNAPDAGPKFGSIAELHQALVQRDERDVLPGGSVSLRSLIQPHKSKHIIYSLIPNLDVKFQKVPVRTNSFGFRGPEVRREKPPGTYRVALLGDSFAFGWGVKEDEIFARTLQDLLQAELLHRGTRTGQYSGINPELRKVEVLNFGVPGYSTFQEVALLKQTAMAFTPDVVIVYFVENDFGLPYFLDTRGDGPLEEATSFVKSVFKNDNSENAELHRELVNMSDANRALLRLNKFLKQENLPGFLFLNPGGNHSEMLKKLWAQRKLTKLRFVDLFSDFSQLVEAGHYERSALQLPDDPHPSALKHRLLAQLMAPYLAETMLSEFDVRTAANG